MRANRAALAVASLAALAVVASSAAEQTAKSSTDTGIRVERDGLSFNIVVDRPSARLPRGTAVLMHGFPGRPLGQEGWQGQGLLVAALLDDGYSVVRFDYLGSWRNRGVFSWSGGVRDAEAVIAYLRTPDARGRGIEGSSIVLVGHSYGGWVALMTAAHDPGIRCVAVLASANMGKTGKIIRDGREAYERRVALYDAVLRDPAQPIRAASGEALAIDLVANAEAMDLTSYVEPLRSRSLLFVSAGNDQVVPSQTYIEPLVARLRGRGAAPRTATVAGAGHNFTDQGPQVNAMVHRFIATQCDRRP